MTQFKNILTKEWTVCLELEPSAAGSKARINPLSYGDTSSAFSDVQTACVNLRHLLLQTTSTNQVENKAYIFGRIGNLVQSCNKGGLVFKQNILVTRSPVRQRPLEDIFGPQTSFLRLGRIVYCRFSEERIRKRRSLNETAFKCATLIGT